MEVAGVIWLGNQWEEHLTSVPGVQRPERYPGQPYQAPSLWRLCDRGGARWDLHGLGVILHYNNSSNSPLEIYYDGMSG
jgi:hypothetical protein